MLQAQQIVTQACQIAKVPGFTSQGGQYLNQVLEDLCRNYDFDLAKKTFNFNFNPGLVAPDPQLSPGSGPYPLPADYLRAKKGDVMWFLLGVPYPMIPIDLEEFDVQVQQAGIQSYPYWFATDVSLNANSTPVAYVYPPASGAYPVRVRYYSLMADIPTPETSAVVPWFPDSNFLITKVAALLMANAGDDRMAQTDAAAEARLTKYLRMKDDRADRAQSVSLDRRRFGRVFTTLPNTKKVGW